MIKIYTICILLFLASITFTSCSYVNTDQEEYSEDFEKYEQSHSVNSDVINDSNID